jgi:hypothetical protein
MRHRDDNPECSCSDCRMRRFQRWRVVIEAGADVLRRDGAWVIVRTQDRDALDDADGDDEDGRRAA